MSLITPEQLQDIRQMAEGATIERCTPQLLLALRGLLLNALEDIELLTFWHDEALDALGHRTDQVGDLEEALDEYENGWREDPDEARQDRGNLPRFLANLRRAIAGRGPLSKGSRAALEEKAEAQGPLPIGGRSALVTEMEKMEAALRG